MSSHSTENRDHSVPNTRILQSPSSETPLPLSKTPNPSNRLPLAIVRPQWHGLSNLCSLVVFGASYCSFSTDVPQSVWVKHFVDLLSERSVNHEGKNDKELEVRNYAFPGAFAMDDLRLELSRFFSEHGQDQRNGKPVPSSEETLYSIFLGINDCANIYDKAPEKAVAEIFKAMHELYLKAGARNFLLIDVPPVDRSPMGVSFGEDQRETLKEHIRTWNHRLREQTEKFAEDAAQATVFLFSSHHFLTPILDTPQNYGLASDPGPEHEDERKRSAAWGDHVHWTDAVHRLFARAIIDRMLVHTCSPV